jgi:16S rRNA pseudouridine516 synthase
VFAAGDMVLEGEAAPLAPALLEPLSSTTAYLTITEGRYHQVRRMFAAVGNHVEALHRDRMGGLTLPEDLPPGAWRRASEDDLGALFRDPRSAGRSN